MIEIFISNLRKFCFSYLASDHNLTLLILLYDSFYFRIICSAKSFSRKIFIYNRQKKKKRVERLKG